MTDSKLIKFRTVAGPTHYQGAPRKVIKHQNFMDRPDSPGVPPTPSSPGTPCEENNPNITATLQYVMCQLQPYAPVTVINNTQAWERLICQDLTLPDDSFNTTNDVLLMEAVTRKSTKTPVYSGQTQKNPTVNMPNPTPITTNTVTVTATSTVASASVETTPPPGRSRKPKKLAKSRLAPASDHTSFVTKPQRRSSTPVNPEDSRVLPYSWINDCSSVTDSKLIPHLSGLQSFLYTPTTSNFTQTTMIDFTTVPDIWAATPSPVTPSLHFNVGELVDQLAKCHSNQEPHLVDYESSNSEISTPDRDLIVFQILDLVGRLDPSKTNVMRDILDMMFPKIDPPSA